MSTLYPWDEPECRNRRITSREAMAQIPRLDDFCDAGDGPAYFMSLRGHDPTGFGNVMILGQPGTGKTKLCESVFQEVLNNPLLHNGDLAAAGRIDDYYTGHGIRADRSEHDIRFWQTNVPYRIFAYARFDGATDTAKLIEKKVHDIYYCECDHGFVLLDESGELYFRGLEEAFRPVLTAKNITTLATAQNFHSKKRRSDTLQEDQDRLRAFLRRFPKVIDMQRPGEDAHLKYLAQRIREWDLKVDHPSTLRLLVQKSDGIVGYSLRLLCQAIDTPDRTLTEGMVTNDDVDPSLG